MENSLLKDVMKKVKSPQKQTAEKKKRATTTLEFTVESPGG